MKTHATFTGAVPLIYATLLLTVMFGLIEKLAAFTAANCAAMLLFACESHGSMLAVGFSSFSPLAVKALYFASMRGAVLARFNGPLTSSPRARQYILRNVGLL